jgi:hypothetical protein
MHTMETAQLPRTTPEHLLRDLERGGLQIAARSGKLVVRPSRAITPEARELIRENKPDLLHLVRPQPLNAERLSELRKLFRPPGISAMDLLRAIRPRAGTYLGLPHDTVTPQPGLGFFAKALEQGLQNSKTIKHVCRNHDSRKELTLLAAVLVPSGWFIQVKKHVLLVHPPADVSVIEEMLQKGFKHNFVERKKKSD